MKKVLSFAMALAMCLSLAACGGKNNTPGQSSAGGSSSQPGSSGVASSGQQPAAGSDLEYVKGKGALIVGITEFEPMDYKDANGEWIGFDADLARAFAESLGVTAEFQLIEWDSKVMELEGKTLDVVWNGMTLTDDVKAAMECSNPYFNNAQVVIVKKDVADQYQTAESIADLQFAVESGSAGQEILDEMNIGYTATQDQATALLEVQSGTADAAVIDYLMAAAMTGEGTSYADLTFTVSLNDEQYGVGFRKGSDLAAALNEFFKTSYADGTMQQIADTYKIGDKLVEQK
ncbi:amino acid ABC transporter substrate-binding protein [Colidextribacter sp. OB.20]|uniref:transporter substrate-binding domain-containing protein n=1 Tax=Colidextribacter sp. OB.20 TaxID=2304568 RepID=UPI001371675A|nr:transporter substrate-binding domain-containing protein [Colidextribacter sp. OB.20]NBI10741.1 amino acid ABC transporter substrate-binding protein [Colidextribacter sp. OB.20]